MHLHQPDPGKDRGDVRQSRDNPWRKGVEVLCERAGGYPPDQRDQDSGRDGDRQPDAGEDREEQGGAALHRGGVRHSL